MERVDLETVRSAALLSVVPMAGRHLTLASRAFECARPRRQRPAAPAVVAAIDPRHRPLCVEARGRAVLLCGAAPPQKHTHTHTHTHFCFESFFTYSMSRACLGQSSFFLRESWEKKRRCFLPG